MGLEEKEQEREIEGRKFRARPVAWGAGMPALVKLINLASPILAGIFRGGTPNEAVAALFDALPMQLKDSDLKYFAKLFGDASWIQDGKNWAPLVEQNHARYFEAEYLMFMGWLRFCVEVNFGGFFGGVMKGGASGLLKVVTPSKST